MRAMPWGIGGRGPDLSHVDGPALPSAMAPKQKKPKKQKKAKKHEPAPPSCPTVTATIVEEVRADLGEASALVALAGGRFVVADDARGVVLVEGGAARVVVGDLEGLEGLCRVGAEVVAVREDDGAVFCFVPTVGDEARQIGVLPRPPWAKGKKNKGYEGLAFWPPGLSCDGQAHLLAVHEDKPRALAVLAWPSLVPEGFVALDGALAALLPDLADVAVAPGSGEVWIVTDEGGQIARTRLEGLGGPLALLGVVELPLDDDEKPEGLAFDDDGHAWIVTDETGRLLRLAL
jgi:hypothetical protein